MDLVDRLGIIAQRAERERHIDCAGVADRFARIERFEQGKFLGARGDRVGDAQQDGLALARRHRDGAVSQRGEPAVDGRASRQAAGAGPLEAPLRVVTTAVEHACVLCRHALIRPECLPPSLGESQGARAEIATVQDLRGMERALIQAAMERHNGNRTEVARELGINKTTLWRKLKRT